MSSYCGNMQTAVSVLACVFITALSIPVSAEPARVQTPSPVIYLADNLNEEAGLGWCIDTVGRGLSDALHAHSCKPRGGDVQFRYDEASNQIASVAFADKCLVALNNSAGAGFGLFQCDPAEPNQKYRYLAGSFQLAHNAGLCITVGKEIRTAGPFQSRNLILASCTDTETVRLKWVVRD